MTMTPTTKNLRDMAEDSLHPVSVPPEWRYLTDEQCASMWGMGLIAWSGDGEWFAKVGLEDFDRALKGIA